MPVPVMPQAGFNDLYSSVYAILDDAKKSHDLVKLYKGSHAAANPYHSVTGFGEFFFRERRGLFAYIADQISSSAAVATLDQFDRAMRPRIQARVAFNLLCGTVGREGESPADLLGYLVARTHNLGEYRGGSSGLDDEARAFMAAYFRNLGFSIGIEDVLIFTGGFKGVFMAFCGSLMCERDYEELHPVGGRILAAEGYYQSLRLVPPLLDAELVVTKHLTGQAVREWLRSPCKGARAIYVPIVNNATGQVLGRDRALDIAEAVLSHNQLHADAPVYVLGDDVYEGSYLAPNTAPQPIGAITGADLGRPSLGRMSDYTVTVVTPSKTVAYPACRVAFATTTSPRLRNALAHYRTVFSHSRVPQVDELTGVAALCLTPQTWIDAWNQHYRDRLTFLRNEIANINGALGFEAFGLGSPDGGWYLSLQIAPSLFTERVTSNVDAFAVLLHYGRTKRSSGIAMLPGEMFGHRRDDSETRPFVLRGNFAAEMAELCEFTTRLREVAFVLGTSGRQVEDHALARVRTVADVDRIVSGLRY